MGVDFGYRGQRLGLPEEGPGSIARVGRRLGALFIDWALCLLIAYGLLSGGKTQSASNWALVVFAVLSVLTVGTVGFTPGKRLLGLRVVAEGGGRISLPRVLLRTLLLVVVIPAVVWDRDGRGLHDRLSRSVQVRI
ncbi:RDD family protein [Streptomyces sp. GS7]|nr:RDD family protein [Streptomyces sp. GS7]